MQRRRPTRSAARPGPATSPPALLELAERRTTGDLPRRRRRAVLVARARRRDLRAGRRATAASLPDDHRGSSRGPRRGRPGACSAPSAPTRVALPPWQEGLALPRRAGDARMKLLVCGGAGFIGSNFVRVSASRARRRGRRARQAHLRRPAREPRRTVDARARPRRDRGPRRRRARRSTGVDAVVNFAAETHVDRSIAEPDAFVATHARGTYVLLEAARERGVALRAGLHRRGLRLDRGGLVHRGLAARSRPRPTARRRPAPTCSSPRYFHTYGLEALICRGSNNYGPYQYPEKLIPLMVLNALHGDPLPVYGDGMQVRNWIYVEDFARGIGHVLEHGAPGRGLQRRRPRRVRRTSRSCKRILELHRRRRVADRVRHRPPRPRPPLLARLGEGPRAGLGGRRCASPRASSAPSTGTATTPRWWEPIRSGDYRAYYERQYGRALAASARAQRRPSDLPAAADAADERAACRWPLVPSSSTHARSPCCR